MSPFSVPQPADSAKETISGRLDSPHGGLVLRPLELFVAEDIPADLECLQHVLDQTGLPYHLTIARDGEEAKNLLRKEGKYAQAPNPDLILLDMKMPKLDGPEVLNGVPGSERMPICIVSSTERKYIEYEIPRHRHISYLLKPIDEKKLLSCFRSHAHLRPLVDQVSRGR